MTISPFVLKPPCSGSVVFCDAVDAEGNRLFTFTILTVDSSQRLAWLHDRMPALLKSEEQIQAWLHTDKSTADVDKLLQQVHM